jgi:hypothetical protein
MPNRPKHLEEDKGRIPALCFLVASVFLWALYVLPRCFSVSLSDDTAVFSYIAQRLLAGDVLYRDVWDHKGPVIFYLDAFGLLLGGGSYAGIKVVEFVLMATSAMLVYSAVKSAIGRLYASLVSLFFTVAIFKPLGVGNFTEEYAVFFQSVALFCISRLEGCDCRRRALYAFLTGLTGALAFYLRANLIGLWLVIVIWWLLRGLMKKDYEGLVRDYFWSLTAFLALSGIIFGYFAWKKVLPDLLEGFIYHNISYSDYQRMSLAAKLGRTLSVGQAAFPYLPIVVLACAVAVYDCLRVSRQRGLLSLGVTCWFAVEIAMSSASGYLYPHYVIPWALPLAFLTVYMLFFIGQYHGHGSRTFSGRWMWVLVVVAVASLWFAWPAVRQAQLLYENRNDRYPLVEYIAANTTANDTVYMYESHDARDGFHGDECLSTLFFARRKLPTPYVYSFFMVFARDEFKHKMVETLYSNWQKSPPALLVTLPLEEHQYFLDDPRIKDLILSNYRQVDQITGYLIWKPIKSAGK